MNEANAGSTITARRMARTLAVVMSVLLLPPFIALAIVPALLFLTPVALIALPFVVPAFLSGWRSARVDDQRRADWRAEAASWPALTGEVQR